MPGMSGRDLAERLDRMRPGIGTLFMSGYAVDVITHHGVLKQKVRFIQKPFSMNDLASTVRDALNSGDS
jgi:FixJ family two-component response regulator